MPTPQRKARKAPPPGQPKLTAKRAAEAAAAIAYGDEPEALKRHRTEAAAAAAAEADGDAQDELEDEDEAMESASDGMSGPSLVMSDVSAKPLRVRG